MRFEWNEEKSRQNLQKHGVSFETATLAFEDPLLLTERDLTTDMEERWNILGRIGAELVLFSSAHVVRAGWRRSNTDHFSA